MLKKRPLTIVCVLVALSLILGSISAYCADFGTVGPDETKPVWYGVPVNSLRVDVYTTIPNTLDGVWTENAQMYDTQKPDLSYTVGMPNGVVPNGDYSMVNGTSHNNSQTDVEYQNGYTYNYLPVSTTINARKYSGRFIIDTFLNSTIVSGSTGSTCITLDVGAFTMSSTHDTDRYLNIIPFTNVVPEFADVECRVQYEFTFVKRLKLRDGSGYDVDEAYHQKVSRLFTWSDGGMPVVPWVLTDQLDNYTDSNKYSGVEFLVTNLTVTAYNVPPTGSADSNTGYAPLHVSFAGKNGATPYVVDYSNGGTDALTTYQAYLDSDNEDSGMLDWLIDSVDGFMSFELIDGFSFYTIFGMIAGVCILIMILKMFAGG